MTNGEKLRLLRDSARLSKPTYLEFDLRAMIEGNAYSEFVVFYRLLHYTRFPHEGSEPHECLLENYYNQGIEKGGRVREKLRDGVKSALETLGTALVGHPRNDALRGAIREGQLDETGYYRQLLNFVYRVLFLMVTEERKLLFTESGTQRQAIYERYYSVTSLRDRAERLFTGDAHGDLWDGLAQTFRLFREEEAARRLGISPLNGELFRQSASGDIEAAFCPNESFLAAMRHLSTFDDSGIRRRVNYAHLGRRGVRFSLREPAGLPPRRAFGRRIRCSILHRVGRWHGAQADRLLLYAAGVGERTRGERPRSRHGRTAGRCRNSDREGKGAPGAAGL